jgi:hypothetical protein
MLARRDDVFYLFQHVAQSSHLVPMVSTLMGLYIRTLDV